MELRKVLGTNNPGDMMTKYLARMPLDGCMVQLNQHRVTGRAQAGLNIQGAKKSPEDSNGVTAAKAAQDMGPAREDRSRSTSVLERKARFQPAEVIPVECWKELTKVMNHSMSRASMRTKYVTTGSLRVWAADATPALVVGLGELMLLTILPLVVVRARHMACR